MSYMAETGRFVVKEKECFQFAGNLSESECITMTNTLMEYKGYHAKIEFDQDDCIFVGQVIDINDMAFFHGTTVEELSVEFENSINNYLEHCNGTA